MSRPVLVEPQQAMWDYLDALLREIPKTEPEAAAEPEAVVAAAAPEIQDWDPAALDQEAAALEAPAGQAVTALAPAEQIAPTTPSRTESAVELEAEGVKVLAAESRRPPAVPEWAQDGFQALLFQVSGLTLAVPLVKLHSVIPWPESDLAGMPHRPDWCLGLLRHREQTLTVVDTATLVIPADKRAGRELSAPQHILVVGDGRWGLACTRLGDVVRLGPQEVKWRTAGGRRPWLAGTVLGHLCALMDTEAFAQMLEAGDKRES